MGYPTSDPTTKLNPSSPHPSSCSPSFSSTQDPPTWKHPAALLS